MINFKENIQYIRSQFPILSTKIGKQNLVYFDNAATTQKPSIVIETLNNYYLSQNSNIHRGVHHLSQKATEAYELARKKIQNFINSKSSTEIIFTRGTTEAINLVASSFSKQFIKSGDEVLISAMEHHSNIVPWQIACESQGAKLKVIPILADGTLENEIIDALITEKTRIIAITHVSNALGTINPIKAIIAKAHQKNVPVLIDGAQALAHLKVDVQDLDCDFYCFSAHKIYGPMGIGVLYGKENWLEKLPPYQGGGEMIKDVSFEKTTYNELPFKFEAGTPNVGDAIAFGVALDYLMNIGFDSIHYYENELLNYATNQLINLGYVKIIGTAQNKTGVISFVLDNIHHYDAGVILDKLGIAVRTGHHCTQPIMNFYNIQGTIRASFALYNTFEEIDLLVNGIKKVKEMLS